MELQSVNLASDGQPTSGSGRFYAKQQVELVDGDGESSPISSEYSVLEGEFSFVSTKRIDNRDGAGATTFGGY